MTVLIINGALLGIPQDFIRLGRLFELVLSDFIARVAVGMIFERKLAVGGFQLRISGIAADIQYALPGYPSAYRFPTVSSKCRSSPAAHTVRPDRF